MARSTTTRNRGLPIVDDRQPIGHECWAAAKGYNPEGSTDPSPEMLSHETVCVLNTGLTDVDIAITVYFSDREPAGPYRETVPAPSPRLMHRGAPAPRLPPVGAIGPSHPPPGHRPQLGPRGDA